MTTRDTRNAPSPSLPQHQIAQQRQKRLTPFDQTGVHYNALGCTCVCVCDRMHLSQCTWLYLKVSLYPKHTHQDQSSTPRVPSCLSTLIFILPSFHVRCGKRCWNTEDYQHSVSSLTSLSSSSCRHSCRFLHWRDWIHLGFFWVVSWIILPIYML